jgi:hypothetical protein
LGEVWSVRANECYRVLKRELKPWLKEHGYHYTPRLVCSWYKKLEDKFLIIIASHNKGGGDNYTGLEFRIDVQFNETTDRNYFISKNIAFFLSDKQVETALKLQNAVIKRFRRADSNHPLWETFKKSQWLKDTYLLRYEQQTQMPTYLENFWFHYLEEEDVVNRSKYLQTVIPTIEAHYQSQISISK